ncbi:hypothetical protein ISN44_As06g025720 [Arabidopsis suecica]|uniref:Uncharacterized protein n=1 Tax=Arabidopsis suecica TaxID=45249 RepID=A0A8T2CJE5_ARASU|nr:hypothetical protein ISN44_As06g025720 [Arabidopsis suecica]
MNLKSSKKVVPKNIGDTFHHQMSSSMQRELFVRWVFSCIKMCMEARHIYEGGRSEVVYKVNERMIKKVSV